MRAYFVYIMASTARTLYAGMTNDLRRRVHEHKTRATEGFTSRYQTNRLVFYEEFATAREAIEAEKRIKGWRREKKVALIQERNPGWRDLSLDWEEPEP
jgi:putative endonuclease